MVGHEARVDNGCVEVVGYRSNITDARCELHAGSRGLLYLAGFSGSCMGGADGKNRGSKQTEGKANAAADGGHGFFLIENFWLIL